MNLRELFEALPIPIGPMIGDLAKGGTKAAGRNVEKEVGSLAKKAVKGQAIDTAVDAVKEKEKTSGSIGIIFGRFNPPHKGHVKAWSMTSENSAWYVGTNQDTQGPKDPLPFDVKIEVMKAMYPNLEGHLVAEQSWLTLASYAFKKHSNIKTLFCYTDEAWVTKTIMAYNGKEGPHGFYKFENIEQKATPRLSSATDLRNAVQAGDREAFTKAAGVPADTIVAGHPFFDLVSHYLSKYPVKIKEVNDAVRAMRAKNSVAEGTTNGQGIKAKGITKNIDPTQKAAMKNAITMPDLNQSSGSAYLGWRMGIALAGAPDYPTKAEADNWIGGDPLLSPYTEEEAEMVKAASLAVGGGRIENWSGKRSQELPSTNKVSAVAKPKRNKYGI